MIRRSAALFLTTVALFSASLAWAGWLYLHTAADPAQSGRLVHSVLADTTARHQLAADITGQVATAANQALASVAGGALPVRVDPKDPKVQAAVDTALADPRLQADLAGALAAVHAGVVGVAPAQPPVIHGDVVNTVVHQYVAGAYPQLADKLPALPPTTITLPTPNIPVARTVRSLATTWDDRLALLALAGIAAAFALGNRPRVLRRAGIWAIGAGVSWALLPRIADWAGGKWAPGNSAVVRTAVGGLGGPVPSAATALLVAGITAVAASLAWSFVSWRAGRTRPDVTAVAEAARVTPTAAERFGVAPAPGRVPAVDPAPVGAESTAGTVKLSL